MTYRPLKWLATGALSLLGLLLLTLLWLAVFGWNWARGPLQDLALRKTGRELHIAGNLGLDLAWPAPRVRAQTVSFANPAWAMAPQMLTADAVEASLDLPALLRGRLAFPELRLVRPRVALEQASGGRKTWLLDTTQTDEDARILIGRVLLDQGQVSYTDADRKTAVRAELSTVDTAPGTAGPLERSVAFKAEGRLLGLPLAAQGSGGAVLAWRDDARPYPLKIDATLGRTTVQAEGSVTSLLEFSAINLQLSLRGDSLASLYPLIGIALPPTPAYRSSGRLVHNGTLWRYETFTGQIGNSDVAGTLQVDTQGARPMLRGALTAQRLDLADLGPAVGARVPAAAGVAPARAHVLPDLPLDTARWASLDADVALYAHALLPGGALPLDRLQVRMLLQDRVLTLEPLEFGVAGGHVKARIVLDSRTHPLLGHAKVQLRGALLARLLPTVDLGKTSLGQLDGDFELAGRGASVGRLFATADGRLSLVAQNGEISRLLMEQTGLHLLEILQLNLTGDHTVKLNCAVADFSVTGGVMQARALVLDTAVNTLVGTGRVDLRQETLDLTIVPRTKVTSLVALRSPVYVKGSFGQPVITVDTGRVAVRGAGALLLGLLNPLLALVPLFEAGPGVDSECARLVRDARTAVPKTAP